MNYKVIIVDDDPAALFLYAEIIKEFNFTKDLTTFNNAQKALDFLQHIQDKEKRIILLDLNMPMMSGWDFLDHVKDYPSKNFLSIFILTSSVNSADKDRSKTYTYVADFFEKPLTEDHIKIIKEKINKS